MAGVGCDEAGDWRSSSGAAEVSLSEGRTSPSALSLLPFVAAFRDRMRILRARRSSSALSLRRRVRSSSVSVVLLRRPCKRLAARSAMSSPSDTDSAPFVDLASS